MALFAERKAARPCRNHKEQVKEDVDEGASSEATNNAARVSRKTHHVVHEDLLGSKIVIIVECLARRPVWPHARKSVEDDPSVLQHGEDVLERPQGIQDYISSHGMALCGSDAFSGTKQRLLP